jgi:hypothetical protein
MDEGSTKNGCGCWFCRAAEPPSPFVLPPFCHFCLFFLSLLFLLPPLLGSPPHHISRPIKWTEEVKPVVLASKKKTIIFYNLRKSAAD